MNSSVLRSSPSRPKILYISRKESAATEYFNLENQDSESLPRLCKTMIHMSGRLYEDDGYVGT